MKQISTLIRYIGHPVSSFIIMLGECARLLTYIISGLGYALKRPQLIIKKSFLVVYYQY